MTPSPNGPEQGLLRSPPEGAGAGQPTPSGPETSAAQDLDSSLCAGRHPSQGCFQSPPEERVWGASPGSL